MSSLLFLLLYYLAVGALIVSISSIFVRENKINFFKRLIFVESFQILWWLLFNVIGIGN